jgi:hypothetical protein
LSDLVEPDGYLHARCQFCSRAYQIAPEKIGRVFDPRRWRRDASPSLLASIARMGAMNFGSLAVSRVLLMRSDLHPKGARYRELSSADLA